MEVQLTTTQSYYGSDLEHINEGGNIQFLQGRLSVLDIVFKNNDTRSNSLHRRWPGTVIGTGDIKAGVRYTVTAVHADDLDADLSDVGGYDFSELKEGSATERYNNLEVGYSFVASKDATLTLNAGTTFSYSSVGQAVGQALQLIGSRATVVAIGKVTHVANSTTGSWTVILENSGYDNAPTKADGFDRQFHQKLLTSLNEELGNTDLTSTADFEITINSKFVQ